MRRKREKGLGQCSRDVSSFATTQFAVAFKSKGAPL